MSEDQRMARNSREPAKSSAPGAARWIGYLDWMRSDLIAGVLALSPAEQRTSRLSSGWTPLELLSHALHMEQRWFVWGFLGEQVAEPWGDWNIAEPWRSDDDDEVRDQARWTVPDDVDAGQLIARLEELGERTRQVLRDFAPSDTASPGGRFAEDPPTLDWICFHVLAEYARHVGHLDIAVELARPSTD